MDQQLYTGRELSWLQFNKRVLEESFDSNNPLLEKLRFLSIFSSNLDEYFMIRISGMKSQIELGLTIPDKKTGYMPKEYLDKMLKKSQKLVSSQYDIYDERIKELNQHFKFTSYQKLTHKQQIKMDNYFINLVFPILTPIRFSQHLPFPLLPNLSVYLMCKLVDSNNQEQYSVVTVPKNVERVVQVKKETYVLLEDIIENNIDTLYDGFTVKEIVPFRITRDFDIEFDNQSDDFASAVMNKLKNRKRGDAVRLEIATHASDEIINFLSNNLKLSKKYIFKINGPIDLTFLNEVYDLLKIEKKGLAFEDIKPITPISFPNNYSLFDVIRKKDVLLFHPFHSYDTVINLLKEASLDPDVVAIKQTIYRTNKDSQIMEHLIRAAESGKQVTVLFELRARFDEENNLHLGHILERVGAHVIYGVPTLKTHSKVLLIVRRTKNLVERFVHFSTGNYNETNAKIYTDASYFTSKKAIGQDATKFFNYISSFGKKPDYNKLYASPFSIREEIFQLIDQEIMHQDQFGNGHIIIKVNSISDYATINKLYEASQKGVKIDLIVRGICCLIPGIESISDNIHVRSIVGRYLEHMRIYYFHNNGKKDMFISSADLMTRNMEARIELALKITDVASKNKIERLLTLQLKDNQKARINLLGKYSHVEQIGKIVNSQLDLYKHLK